MQTTPDQSGFMSADDVGADPSQGAPTDGGDPSQDPTQMGGDPMQGGGDPSADTTGGGFMDGAENDPDANADADLSGVQHGAFMGGADSQHPGTDTMLTQDETQVSPEEQKAYDDFVTRALLFISDTRKPLGKNGQPNPQAQAPADVIIQHLNLKGMPADQAVGRTTAQVCWLIYTNAMHQKVEYPPDVVYHAADEVMSHLYEIGVQSGAIKNPPPPDSPQEQKLLGMAKMYACQYFGNNVIDAGLNDKDANRQFYAEQMKREADSGGLDQWSPSQAMSPNQLSDFMSRASQGKAALASMRGKPPSSISDFQSRGHPSLVPSGGAPQPAAPPDQGGDQSGGDQSGQDAAPQEQQQ